MLATPAVASTTAFLRGMPPMIWNYVLFLYLRRDGLYRPGTHGLYYRPFWSVLKLQTPRKQVCGSLFPKFEVCRMVSARGGRRRGAGCHHYSEALCSGMTL